MKQFFKFIIDIYDKSGNKQYNGDGGLVTTDEFIKGYVCNDYVLVEVTRGYIKKFSFYSNDAVVGSFISTKFEDMLIDLPGKHELSIKDSSELSMIELEVNAKVTDPKERKKIQETLEEVKSIYNKK